MGGEGSPGGVDVSSRVSRGGSGGGGSGGGGGGGDGEEALRAELRRSEEARKDAMLEIDRLRAEALVFAARSQGSTANSVVGGGGGAISEEQRSRSDARVKIVELQYEQFRQEMALRLEEKNGHLHQLEEDNARLRLTSSSVGTTSGGGEAVAAVAEAEAEVAALNERVDGYTRERAALKTILENKISTLVEGISRSLRELPDEAQRHPRLAREVSALDRLVNATVHAMEY
jgi:hypothetical protein